MDKRHLDVLEFAAQAQRCSDLETLVTKFATTVGRFGFDSFIFTGLPKPGLEIAPLIIADHWPAGWTERYSRQNYFTDDPVGRWSISKRRPFQWREAQEFVGSTPRTRQIASEAWDHGLADGIAYPLRGENDAVVSLASEVSLSVDPMMEASIFLAVSYFKAAAEDIARAAESLRQPKLTFRELEVLKWMAAGKTAWETSCILSISESTVKIHRTSIRTKLGAATAIQATAIAIRHCIIPF